MAELQKGRLFVPCAGGVEPLLAEELRTLLPEVTQEKSRGGVALVGATLLDAMRINLWSRLATRVLVELGHGPCRDETELYEFARDLYWEAWITPQQTLRVDVSSRNSPLPSLQFAGLRVKDAVCDALREAFGERPSVDTRDPDLPIVLHLEQDSATLYADASGEPLFKRGWRQDTGDAPLKETLAAAMLAFAGWRGTPEAGGAFNDPCCGSGTLVIEAAQIACGMAPGGQRRFAFERQLPYRGLLSDWQRMKQQARAAEHAPAVPLFGSDVAFRMVDFASRNAERAGVAHAIRFQGGDALERPAPALPADLPGTLMLNPPYGDRIDVAGKAGRPHGLAARDLPPEGAGPLGSSPARAGREEAQMDAGGDFFNRLAAHWKRQYAPHPAGWSAWLLSPDRELPRRMRLKESRKLPLWNGPIECRLFRFDLVAGSNRT
ncbi:MAG: class I SAM-dependent RNA methyltransferase [Burkholderiales bacterium]|nr:class I SAM-dependent RNA methyltransferase [Burkholderiales bacterium]